MAMLYFSGSALAQVCAYFTLFALTFLYIVWTKAYKDTWGGKLVTYNAGNTTRFF